MRRVMSLIVLALVGFGLSGVSAQVTDPANPRVHAVIGIVTEISPSSLRLRVGDGERELKIDKTTRVTRVGGRPTLQNDGVLREHQLSDFVKVGERALVTYRDDDGVLTAVIVRLPRSQTRP